MEHEFAFFLALTPADRQFLRATEGALTWDAEALTITINSNNEHFRKAIAMHFEGFVRYPLPWPWRVAAAAAE